MTNLITPPPELVQQWANASPVGIDDESWAYEMFIAHHAAQWGADQELEACCAWLKEWQEDKHAGGIENLRAARRPKPPSLAEQATAEMDDAVMRGDCITTTDAMPLLRAALKRLAELEALPMTDLITPPLELMQRVATTLHFVTDSNPNAPVDEWMPEARAVIWIVAAWLREQEARQ
jgi:hypothetical protein